MLNTPNSVTLLRILLIPVFMVFLLVNVSFIPISVRLSIAVGLFVFAAASDGLDGYLARAKNEVTVFGQFFDPLADKLLISAALISLVDMGRLSAWVAMLIISREFAVSGLRLTALRSDVVIPASPLGKAKTISQIVAIVAMLLRVLLVNSVTAGPLHILLTVSFKTFTIDDFLMGIAVILTLVSGMDYFLRSRDLLVETRLARGESID